MSSYKHVTDDGVRLIFVMRDYDAVSARSLVLDFRTRSQTGALQIKKLVLIASYTSGSILDPMESSKLNKDRLMMDVNVAVTKLYRITVGEDFDAAAIADSFKRKIAREIAK